MSIIITLGKVMGFIAVAVILGRFVYPRLTLPFRSEGGKGFTFILLMAPTGSRPNISARLKLTVNGTMAPTTATPIDRFNAW